MIVTVTGANGFIGLHLVQDQLARGRKVRAVDLKKDKLLALPANPDLEIIQADIRDKEAMVRAVDGAAFVFHLASAHLAVSLPEAEYWRINRDAALSLAEICRQAGVKRLVHCSSVGVYGEIKEPPADEASPCHPDLIYEKSKLEGEQAVLAYQRQSGLPLTVLRPVWVYGPGCPRTEKLFRSLRKRTFFISAMAAACAIASISTTSTRPANSRPPGRRRSERSSLSAMPARSRCASCWGPWPRPHPAPSPACTCRWP